MEEGSMNRITIFLLTFLLGSSVLLQQSSRRSKKPKMNVEKFVLAPFPVAIHADSVKVVVFLEIPYYSLQFIKKGDSFFAYYQASLGIRHTKKRQDIAQMVWSDSIKVDLYTDTRSLVKNRKHFTEFTVHADDQYEILGELQDLDTRKKGLLKRNIDLRPLTKRPSLMKPIFMLDLPGNWGFDEGKIPTRGFRVKEIGIGVDLKISGFVVDDYEVNIFLANSTADDSLIQKFTGNGSLGYFTENIFIPSAKLNSLKNDFRITLKQGKKTEEKEISFSKYKPGISSYVDDIEVALKQMRYILSNEERKDIKKRLKDDKEQLFYNLWKERDPTPETEYNELMEEYFQRVGYVNEHFSGWQPGWETDRGMIYILFGPPDEIQRSNPTSTTNAVYQIWSYFNISKQFVFRDQNGFGDYRLDTPFMGAGL